MSTWISEHWITVLITTLVFVSPFVFFGYLRASKPHSKKMSKEQEQLDKKTGTNNETPVVTTSARTDEKRWFAKYLWSILIFLIGAGVVLWGIKNPVSLADTAGWREFWFSLLVFWGVLATLIALNAEKKVAGTLQWILAGVMVLILIIIAVAWWKGDEKPNLQNQQQLVQVPRFVMPAGGDSEHIRPPVGYAVRITSGAGYTLHYVYADGREGTVGDPRSPRENGHIVRIFARDITGRANSVTYAFVRSPN